MRQPLLLQPQKVFNLACAIVFAQLAAFPLDAKETEARLSGNSESVNLLCAKDINGTERSEMQAPIETIERDNEESSSGLKTVSPGIRRADTMPDTGRSPLGKEGRRLPPMTGSATTTRKLKVALVLGGGGARGAAHVGVLKVLTKEKVPFDLVVGTSMGAIVGGFYCAGLPMDKIERMFCKGKVMQMYMTVPVPVRMVQAPFILMLPRVVYHPYDGLYYGNRFRGYLEKQLPNGRQKIEDLKKAYAAVAVDLLTGQVETITRGSLCHAMQASSAVPGLRKPVHIGDKLFVDGGVLSNIPVAQAKKLGADVIIAVNVDERFERMPPDHFRKMGSVSKRIVALQITHISNTQDLQTCVTIKPNVTGIGLLSRSSSDAAKAIKAGEEAAIQALPEIRKCLEDAGIKH
ncbi:MAG: patatin-like phospholipase family protein [Mycobacteriaceae bacterium]|nr:patatin-like phospholipase family protein [Mycobacteriaceae bacterium]